jgi:molybdopterin synthase sulfur carrier subunit
MSFFLGFNAFGKLFKWESGSLIANIYGKESETNFPICYNRSVKIRVLFFAQPREIVGKNQMDFEVSEGETITFLIKKLQSQFPALLTVKFVPAVNSEYIANDYKLHDGDQVALIPPISGG